MSERFLDDLARTLATPMPRRRALRLAGAALVAGAVPGLRARSARAGCGPDTPCSSLCRSGTPPGACGIERKNSCGQIGCSVAFPNGCLDKNTQCCKGGSGASARAWICSKNDRCGKNGKCIGCPSGSFLCGTTCCREGRGRSRQVCYRGKCSYTCPPKTTKCGKNCCDSKQACRDGTCCDKCGPKCCKPGQLCCGYENEKMCCNAGDRCVAGKCCPNDRSICTGSKLAARCCAPGEVCAPKPNASAIQGEPCCPKIRVANAQGTAVCCPPGTIEIGGNCCPPGQLGCCDFPCADKQICVNGKCVPVRANR